MSLSKNVTKASVMMLLAATVAVVPAQAQIAIYGTGATFPSKLYRVVGDCYGINVPNSAGVIPASFAGCPSTGTAATYEYLYAGIGSGGGRTAFTTLVPPTVLPSNDTLVDPYEDTLTPGVFTYPYPQIDFAGSDSTLSSSNLTAYTTNAVGRGNNLQLPSVIGPVTLTFNPNGFNAALPTDANGPIVKLRRDAYCGIFSGAITSWNDSRITNANGGIVVSTLPITVVRRSDSSGTTDIFTKHLNAVCNLALPNGQPAPFPWTIGQGSTVAWPATFSAQSGSQGIVNTVVATDGAIGYVSADFAKPFNTAGAPTARLQNQAGVNAQFSGGTINYIAPTVAAAQAAFAGAPVPPAATTNPSTGYTLDRTNPNGSTSYPIVGYTYLNLYSCYPTNGQTNGVKFFANKFYTTSLVTSGAGIAASNGFAPLPSALRTQLNTFINGIQTSVGGVCNSPN